MILGKRRHPTNLSIQNTLNFHVFTLFTLYSLCVVGDEKGGLDPPAYTGLLFHGSGGF